MKQTFTFFSLLFLFNAIEAQTLVKNYPHMRTHVASDISKVNLNGQWRGSFNESTPNPFGFSNNSRTTYVLELEIKANTVSGYSYTYFSDLDFNDPEPKRYYTICRIIGTVDRRENSIVVTEVERIKYNTPPTIRNCFQIHRLRYVKGEENTEYLKGDWIPAPNQNCGGKGETVLSRQKVSRTPYAIKVIPKKDEIAKKPKTEAPKPEKPKTIVKAETPKKTEPTKSVTTEIPVQKETTAVPERKSTLTVPLPPIFKGYENRKNNIVKSIKIDNPVFQVDFYDNGEIDGDSISVFYNGKLVVSHKMLTDKALTLTLSIDKNYAQNVITMYAENLGSIPPNTALMIVRDGDKRYEVRMESDMGKSGTVIFTHNPD